MEHDDIESEPFEYVMPLSGYSPRGLSTDNSDNSGLDSPVVGADSDRDGGYNNLRTSTRSDATPHVRNTARFDFEEDLSPPPRHPLPPVPFGDVAQSRSMRSLRSMRSCSTMDSSGQEDGGGGSHSLCGIPKSPASSATPSSHRPRRPPTRDSSVMQISFDGEVREVPIKPPSGGMDSSKAASVRKSSAHRSSAGTTGSGSIHSMSVTEKEEEINDAASSNDSLDIVEPIVFCNMMCPMWFSTLIKKPPAIHQISHFVVRAVPCFWCCSNSVQGSSTDRAVLTRLNILCLFFTCCQLCASLWLAILLLAVDDERGALAGFTPHFWNLNGATFAVGILGFIIIVTCCCTIRVIKEVDLAGAIRYLWVVLWLVPFEIFFNLTLFDYHNVTAVWIRHWWLEPQLSWFRVYFCEAGTVDSLCLVPIYGGEEYESEDAWCMDKYDSTDCTAIRNDAETSMETSISIFYYGLGIWGCCLLVLMLLMVNSLERIISKPIVQKSRETNVPAWLTLPTMGTALVGSLFLYSPSSLLSSSSSADESTWIGGVYLVAAALFLVALLMGWFLSAFSIRNSSDKKTKNIAVIIIIGVMAANCVMLAALFVASIIFSANLVQSPIEESERGEVACFADHNVTCTQCEALVHSERCPEWTLEDVTKILQSQLKQSATLAAIFILYAISVLRFGVTLRKHLSMYQIDYV